MDISMVATLFQRLGAVCLVFVIFWHITQQPAPRRGKAIVHLADANDVIVAIDQRNYRVESAAESPVVSDLEPGSHTARVWQHGVLLGVKHFTVQPGRQVVIAPFTRGPVDFASGSRRAAAEKTGPAELAVRIGRSARASVHN